MSNDNSGGREAWLRGVTEDLSRIFARGGEIDSAVRGALATALERLDVVSRDEFDAQTEVLRRARGQLEALEHRLAALEGDTQDSAPGG